MIATGIVVVTKEVERCTKLNVIKPLLDIIGSVTFAREFAKMRLF